MRTIKLFHISDIHIGMKFQRYPESLRANLIEARFESLLQAVTLADAHKCDVFAITGDIFESIKVTKKDVDRVCDILKRFSGEAIWVLPGNHDYYDPSLQIWKWFEASMPDSAVLFHENKRYTVTLGEMQLDVFAAPCENKHSAVNHLDWIKANHLTREGTGRILLAHGAIKDISPDLNNLYYPVTLSELSNLNMDLCLLGHTHIPYPAKDNTTSDRIFNAGTSEPDGLNYKYEGSGWLIELTENGDVKAERMKLGKYRFFDINQTVSEHINATDLLKAFGQTDLIYTVARVRLEGYLDRDAYEARHDVYQEIRNRFAYLEIDDDLVKAKFTKEMIRALFPEGSLPSILLEDLIESEDVSTAHLAYEIMDEVMHRD